MIDKHLLEHIKTLLASPVNGVEYII